MAKEVQEQFSFDRNQFTRDLLSSGVCGSVFKDSVNELLYAHKAKRPINMSRYLLETKEEVLTQIRATMLRNKKFDAIRVYDTIDQIYNNPESEPALAFYEYWNFIRDIFPPLNDISNRELCRQQILVIIKKSESLFDAETQLALNNYIVTSLEGYLHPQELETVYVNIIKNEDVNGLEKAKTLHMLIEKQKRPNFKISNEVANADKKMIEDVLESLKIDLDKELNKEYPDTNCLSDIVSIAQKLCDHYRNIIGIIHNPLNSNNPDWIYYDTMKNGTFNKNKILTLDTDYVPKHNQIIEEQYSKEHAEVLSLREKIKQNNDIMQNLNAQLTLQVNTEKDKNEKLTKQLDEMSRELDILNKWVKAAKMKAASLNLGILAGKETKEFRDYISKGPGQTYEI